MKPVNLVPQEQRRRPAGEGGGKSSYALLGVLGVLVAMVAAYVLVSNQVTERENRAAAAQAEADKLEAQASRKASFTDFSQIAEMRLQSVAGVAQTRFDWERAMRELSLVMPEGSWLLSADGSVTGASPEEVATTLDAAGAPVAPQPAITLVGCTRKQSEVARLMVRMGAMHRVTDVELNASTQEDPRAKATVSGCGNFYNFDVTVNYAPTPPASEAPRGSATVPTSLGGGS